MEEKLMEELIEELTEEEAIKATSDAKMLKKLEDELKGGKPQ